MCGCISLKSLKCWQSQRFLRIQRFRYFGEITVAHYCNRSRESIRRIIGLKENADTCLLQEKTLWPPIQRDSHVRSAGLLELRQAQYLPYNMSQAYELSDLGLHLPLPYSTSSSVLVFWIDFFQMKNMVYSKHQGASILTSHVARLV